MAAHLVFSGTNGAVCPPPPLPRCKCRRNRQFGRIVTSSFTTARKVIADEKVTVVEGRGGGATAVAVIVGLVAILAILYVLFGTNLLNGQTKKIDANVKIETPNK